jgi:biopolymer transport protein ExbB
MRRYASSRFRILLFVALIGAALFAMSGSGLAQAQNNPPASGAGATGAGASAAPAGGGAGSPAAGAPGQGQGQRKKETLFTLIVGHLDPVFFVIIGLSIVGVSLIIQGFIKNRATVMLPESSTNAIREMIQQKRFKELIDFTETDPSFVSRALNPALKRAPSFSSMKEAMETSIGEQTAEQFRKIEYLNIIGNLGPLLGLLGTVLGMIEAFNTMNNAGGQANPADLAGGISRALAHTFLGLTLAVPCLAAFGVLRTIVDRLTVRGALIAEEMLLMVKPAEAKQPQPAAAPAPGVPGGGPGGPPGVPRPGMAGMGVGPMPAPVPAMPAPQPTPSLPRKPAAPPTPAPVVPS